MLLSFSSLGFSLAKDETFMKFFDNSSFNLPHALVSFRRLQEADCSDSCCFGCLRYFYAEGTVRKTEFFTVLGRKRGTDGELLPSNNF